MINGISRIVLLIAGLYGVYRYRYRIMNSVLGNPDMRKLFIRMTMSIPYVRNKMMSQAFR
ncbi:hypothetical protein [Bacillus sp. PS06]|uniref:hypothetical protein n=1 Tax=Bacillus sp. PS06 TaxID=2764176 RepID=UPI00177CB071|nr:hypothetical protein [Bacillus sp. PS06]MBD8069139.1 hypothetical protein [Bacillus sp. PS06]